MTKPEWVLVPIDSSQPRCPAEQMADAIRRIEVKYRKERGRLQRRQHLCGPSAQRRHPKKAGEDQAIGHSRGGLSTKIDALAIGVFPTGGQAHDMARAPPGPMHCCPPWSPRCLIADKAFEADERVLEGCRWLPQDAAQVLCAMQALCAGHREMRLCKTAASYFST